MECQVVRLFNQDVFATKQNDKIELFPILFDDKGKAYITFKEKHIDVSGFIERGGKNGKR